jgi:hypothetical protein
MAIGWKDKLSCATECPKCRKALGREDLRILSVFDDTAICMACKEKEEKQPGHEEAARKMVGQCMIDVELNQSDPGGYCYHHFYPYTCKE